MKILRVILALTLLLILGAYGNQQNDNNKSIIKPTHPSLLQQNVEKDTKDDINIEKKESAIIKTKLVEELLSQMRAKEGKPIVSKISSIGKDKSITQIINYAINNN
ncbi:hypothetical protein MNB_SV-15-44 [hydrothermal vent metagenome]|uniref:Uncharacterized protein n=1 Tax=hydrothermal vent metagenome TaxID=652676 RepID=A0A1W1EJM3_9ZZZZ